jgi:acetyl-CoA carboxylase, biotin carboxylase subunit
MFRTVLIANRGEIACRIIQTCRRLGIRTAAVYSDADVRALHVELADEAHHIGPAPVVQSYLNHDAILHAADQAHADAIHPGYGFLSEDPSFAAACADHGFTFVGPTADIIAALGNKVTARRCAQTAGFPVIPGSAGALADADIDRAAQEIGFPLVVKASAGGGGIGMAVARDPAALPGAVRRARSTARRSFGSEEIYLERYIDGGKHVEVQLLGDSAGGVAHLLTRDCSVQRRHQKVIEEAPAPTLDPPHAEMLADAAVGLGRSLGYTNAGTVECLLDSSGQFYFLEMNTRLQVEHPVTEMISGIDLVEQQLRIAAGELLSPDAAGIGPNGHAIECRIYAEDPVTHLPSPGTITGLMLPSGDGVRVDTGVRAGDEVQPFHDPLLAKLVVWAPAREAAIRRLAMALAAAEISGIKTNIPLLRRVIEHQEFQTGRYTTQFLGTIEHG